MKPDPQDNPALYETWALAERRADALSAALTRAIEATKRDGMTITYCTGDVLIDEGSTNAAVAIDLRLIGHTPEELAAALGTIADKLLRSK